MCPFLTQFVCFIYNSYMLWIMFNTFISIDLIKCKLRLSCSCACLIIIIIIGFIQAKWHFFFYYMATTLSACPLAKASHNHLHCSLFSAFLCLSNLSKIISIEKKNLTYIHIVSAFLILLQKIFVFFFFIMYLHSFEMLMITYKKTFFNFIFLITHRT